jgi:trk system potassium uptake protein TrkH
VNALLISHLLGWLLIGVGIVHAVPIAAALAFGEPVLPYAASAVAALAFGFPITLSTRPTGQRMRTRDGFLVVGLAWLLASLFGSLPYYLTGVLSTPDAIFEAASGFTTTGSTVMTAIEAAPRALLLWRSMTQWLGGMGIIVFAIAVMPLLGVGGMQLFRAEMPGPVASKLTPRIAETARRLWMIYLGLTVAEWLCLMLAGMSAFEALCHSFTTLSTGGFSTRSASIGGFGAPAIEWIVIVFMALGGINFVLHYQVITGRVAEVLRDTELRYYAIVLFSGSALVLWSLWTPEVDGWATLRTSLFQVVALTTTTGYATANFEFWPGLAVLVLLQVMILGGMAGSTSGGVKSLRTLIGLRALSSAFVRQLHPQAVTKPVRFGGHRVRDDVLAGIWTFFTAYAVLVLVVAGIVAGAGYDVLTAISSALTTGGTVGPGLGAIGPYDRFAHFPTHVKLTLSVAMIAGRLEIFTILVLFHPDFWRR